MLDLKKEEKTERNRRKKSAETAGSGENAWNDGRTSDFRFLVKRTNEIPGISSAYTKLRFAVDLTYSTRFPLFSQLVALIAIV